MTSLIFILTKINTQIWHR